MDHMNIRWRIKTDPEFRRQWFAWGEFISMIDEIFLWD